MKIICFYANLNKNSGEEEFAKLVLKNKKLKRLTVFTIGNLLYLQDKVLASTTDALSKVDEAGSTLLSVCRKIGYWACIMACAIEIIRSALQGDAKSAGKIMIKYITLFASLYFFPWILDLIKSLF